MRTAFTLVLIAACLLGGPRLAQAQAQPTAAAWRLLVFHAARPGLLSQCESAHLRPDFERHALPDAADPSKARWLTEAAIVQWSGGRFSRPATDEVPASPRLLTDACFTLFVNGAPVISGGVVSRHSARRFEFPALVADGMTAGAPLRLTLAPRFPVKAGGAVPAGWEEALKGLADVVAAPDTRVMTGVCPVRAGASPSQIDVFDGDPSGQAFLAPDDHRQGIDTYTVGQVYEQGRAITIRCHFGKEAVDVKLTKPVKVCRYSGDDARAQMTCK